MRTADPNLLLRDALLQLPPARRARVLRGWIAELGLPPLPAEGIGRIEAELLPAREDADPRFRWRDVEVRAWRDLLQAGPVRAPLPAGWACAARDKAPKAAIATKAWSDFFMGLFGE